ncbi:MAG TPA: PEP-CTERM sorting domain-containing protein [Candidatus Acidoferrum sp.]|nr:PEP-CTERM sorting domain-containing protein [Candidatus Acidoferrum sp.]
MKAVLQKAAVCAACLVLSHSVFALNIVGYINLNLQPGVNLIADQLLQTPDNSLNTILTGSGLADGTSFTMWSNGAFLPMSYYDSGSGTWSINYQLNLGTGGYLTSPVQTTVTFVGQVGPYFNDFGNNIGWNPNYPNGPQLISNPIPIAGDLNYEFYNVTGRNPVAGEGVATWNPLTQTYTESFFNGTQWLDQTLSQPSTATIQVGQSAWFALGANYSMTIPSPVPEPGALALVGLGAGLLLLRRKPSRTVR